VWLSCLQGFKYVLVVAGNHERECGAQLDHLQISTILKKNALNVIYLTFDGICFKEFGDLTFVGLSWWHYSEIGPILKTFSHCPPLFMFMGPTVHKEL